MALSDYPEEHQEWTGFNRGNDNDNKNIAILKFFRNLPHIAGFLSIVKFFYLSSPIFYFHSFPQQFFQASFIDFCSIYKQNDLGTKKIEIST